MAIRHRHRSVRFLRRRFVHALAVGLMLVQAAVGPLHASPGPVRASAGPSAAAIAGILEICTAQGLIRLVAGNFPADRRMPDDRSVPSCPICTATGAAHAFAPPDVPVLPVLTGWTESPTLAVRPALRTDPIAAAHPPRAPPSIV
jgi:hypothetical protein